MRLTRMALDTGKRRTMLALASPSIFHGTVERAFPGERKRNLWRIDELRGSTYLLILSEEEPDLTQAVADLGFDGGAWESRDYGPFLDRISEGSVWRFRLCANPTYSECCHGTRGRVHAHRTPEHQMEWLIRQGERNGFSVSEDSFSVVRSQWQHFLKGDGSKKEVRLLAVTYEGVLTVKDAAAFRLALVNGIGREKAYGMGLLTLMRISE